MVERCPICRRPTLGQPLEPDDRPCSVPQGERCWELGYRSLQIVVAENVAVLRAQDNLLHRARVLLKDVEIRLTETLERLPAEVRGA